MEFYSETRTLPHIPDDLTVPQFFFDSGHPTKPARPKETPWLIEDNTGRKWFGDELRSRTDALANGLHLKYGLGEDDVVVVFSRNHIDYPVVIWATHRLGGVISGANPDFSAKELAYQVEQAKASIIITLPHLVQTTLIAAKEVGLPPDRIVLLSDADHRDQKRDSIDSLVEYGARHPVSFMERRLPPGGGKTKRAFLSFSSGTTGRPKAVAIPHYSLITNVVQLAVHKKLNQNYTEWKNQRFRPGDVALGILPFYHIYGLVLNLHLVLHAGMALVVVPKFSFVPMMESIIRYRVTHLFLVPPHVVLLCKHPESKKYDLRPYLRYIVCGAAPLSHELSQQLYEMLPDTHIGQSYGMTETCTAVLMWPLSQKHGIPGSSGVLLPGIVARVVKEDGSLASYGEPGELWVKTPSVSLGYANNAQATAETFIDGWVRTGDEVVFDRDGEVKVLDRMKEIMKVKGFQVAPAELEGCILEHSDVSNACVVGIPDEYSGEVPLAFVTLTAEASKRAQDAAGAEAIKQAIMKHVADHKTPYKRLAGGVEFVPQIPVSPSGKLLRRVLREQAKGLRRVKSKL